MSAVILSAAAWRTATAFGQHPAQLVEAGAGGRRGHQHVGLGQALGVEQPAQVGPAVVGLVGTERVNLVEHHGGHRGVPGQRHQVAPVHGGVRVLQRVEHPDQHVGHLDQAVDQRRRPGDHRVVVGQVEQEHPGQRRLALIQGARPGVAVTPLHAQPVEQRGGPLHPPHAGVRVLGSRPGHSRGREVRPGQGVEQRGLPAAGASRPGPPRCARRTSASARPTAAAALPPR